MEHGSYHAMMQIIRYITLLCARRARACLAWRSDQQTLTFLALLAPARLSHVWPELDTPRLRLCYVSWASGGHMTRVLRGIKRHRYFLSNSISSSPRLCYVSWCPERHMTRVLSARKRLRYFIRLLMDREAVSITRFVCPEDAHGATQAGVLFGSKCGPEPSNVQR